MDTEDGGTEQQAVSGLGTTARRLCLFTLIGALLVLSATPVPRLIGDHAFLSDFALPWWVMTLAMAFAFTGTETFVLNIQARRETQTISFSCSPR